MARSRAIRKNATAPSSRAAERTDVVERRLVITVCPRERGVVALPVAHGGPRRRLDAAGVARSLRDLVRMWGCDARVSVHEGCAGGCAHAGPNIDVRVYPVSPAGAKPDTVAIAWKTYVYSLASLDCVAAIIEDNLLSSPRSDESD